MCDKGFDFDCCFTSVLTRAIRTLHLVLHEMDQLWLPVAKDWRLNERHYGGLTGLNKQEMIDKVGAEQVKIWRRSYDIPPPPLPDDSPYDVASDRRYAGVEVPRTESLKDTIARAVPYYEAEIAPALSRGKRVLVAAHGNSLRGIIKYLSNIGDEEIVGLEIPTGKPIVYELADDLVGRAALLSGAKPKPQPFARYISSSARAIDRFGRVVGIDHADADRHAERQRVPSCTKSQPAMRSISRAQSRAATFSSACSSRMPNSSPPIRATTSLLRTPLDQQPRDLDQRLVAGADGRSCR